MDTTIQQTERQHSKEGSGLYRKYRSIHYLPVDNFVAISRTSDLRYLLKIEDYEYLPEIPEDESLELQSIWEQIEEEYYKEDAQRRVQAEVTQGKSLLELQTKYVLLNTLLFAVEYNPSYVKDIEELGFKISPERSLKEEVERISKESGQILTRIRIKQKEYERTQQRDKGIEFEELLDIIEKYKGHQVDTSKITVKKWIAIKNNFLKHIKEENGRRRNTKGRNNIARGD